MTVRWTVRAANDRAPQCESRALLPLTRKRYLIDAVYFFAKNIDISTHKTPFNTI